MTAPSASAAPRTVREALAWGTAVLRAAGIETPEIDARLLVGVAASLDALDLLRDPERLLSEPEAHRLAAFLDRRRAHEPVSRILGRREFYGRTFEVTPATLDPRPDTETVVEAALEAVRESFGPERPIRILDVGTGTGCLLLTLLAELPNATGLGTDISEGALGVAARNAAALGLAARAKFESVRSLEGLAETFDVLVSNPPYIPAADISGLMPDARNYDPLSALDGGPDGLDVYRAIAGRLAAVVPQGWAVVEVGAGQALQVSALLKEALGPRLRQIRVVSDLGGHARCVAVQSQNVLMPH